jgi:hypothetical protein
MANPGIPNPMDKPFIGAHYTPPSQAGEGNSFEAWLQKEEAKDENPAATTPIAAAPELVPDAPADAPAPEIPPVTETTVDPMAAPETPEPEAAEAAPPEAAEPDAEPEATPEGEQQRRRRPSWSQVRQLESDLRSEREMRLRGDQDRESHAARMLQLETELARVRGMLEGRSTIGDAPPPIVEPDDPLTVLEKNQQALQQTLEQERQARFKMEVENRVRLQEAEVRSKNPKYDEALNHLVQSEVAELREEGVVTDFAKRILQADPARVRQAALQANKSEREAAEMLAIGALIEARRERLVRVALDNGQNVAERVLALAQRRGWKAESDAKPVSPSAAPAAPKRDPQAVKEASASLSAVSKTTPPPPKPEIKTKADLRQFMLEAPTDVFDSYIFEQDEKDPHWMERLG